MSTKGCEFLSLSIPPPSLSVSLLVSTFFSLCLSRSSSVGLIFNGQHIYRKDGFLCACDIRVFSSLARWCVGSFARRSVGSMLVCVVVRCKAIMVYPFKRLSILDSMSLHSFVLFPRFTIVVSMMRAFMTFSSMCIIHILNTDKHLCYEIYYVCVCACAFFWFNI